VQRVPPAHIHSKFFREIKRLNRRNSSTGLPTNNIYKTLNSPPLQGAGSQFAEPVIPDERRFAGRDPESSESSMTSFGFWFPAFAGTLSGSRLASAAGGLGRDDQL